MIIPEKNGEDELVSAEMNTEHYFSRKLPKVVAVFGHLQVSTRMPARSGHEWIFCQFSRLCPSMSANQKQS